MFMINLVVTEVGTGKKTYIPWENVLYIQEETEYETASGEPVVHSCIVTKTPEPGPAHRTDTGFALVYAEENPQHILRSVAETLSQLEQQIQAAQQQNQQDLGGQNQ